MEITNVNFALGGMNVQTWDIPSPAPVYYLWSWGYNSYGGLGDGTTTSKSSPIQIGALTSWASVSASGPAGLAGSAAIKTDGTLWTWGKNAYGQLGLSNITNYSSPKQVGALSNWSSVIGAYYHSAAIKTKNSILTTK